MKSYRADAGSGLAGLKLNEDPEPEPGPREVLVRVRANSLNFRELSILAGTYPLPVKPDVVMGADGAGEIVALGPDVSRVAIADRIAAARTMIALEGNADALQHRLPSGWELAPYAGDDLRGTSLRGANMLVRSMRSTRSGRMRASRPVCYR
jgi:NADPH:quinone reductase-like Zn-dependent oxidoreductase